LGIEVVDGLSVLVEHDHGERRGLRCGHCRVQADPVALGERSQPLAEHVVAESGHELRRATEAGQPSATFSGLPDRWASERRAAAIIDQVDQRFADDGQHPRTLPSTP